MSGDALKVTLERLEAAELNLRGTRLSEPGLPLQGQTALYRRIMSLIDEVRLISFEVGKATGAKCNHPRLRGISVVLRPCPDCQKLLF